VHSAKSIFGAKLMTQENQTQVKPEFKEAFEKLNLIFQRATSEERAFLEKVVKFLR